MKKFLSIYGTVLFLFVSALLLSEVPNLEIGDTSLYFLNGKSTNLQTFENLNNLTPDLMNFIYAMTIIGIVESMKYKRFYIGMTIGNLIVSTPIFIVHKDTLFFRPFYYSDGIVSYGYILPWIWYIYFSILGGIMMVIYMLYISKRHVPK